MSRLSFVMETTFSLELPRFIICIARKNHIEIDKLHQTGPLAMEPNKILILNVR